VGQQKHQLAPAVAKPGQAREDAPFPAPHGIHLVQEQQRKTQVKEAVFGHGRLAMSWECPAG
jgi:hypothetical protein